MTVGRRASWPPLIDDRKQVDEAQMERWVVDFDSWEVCDQVCQHSFRPHAICLCQGCGMERPSGGVCQTSRVRAHGPAGPQDMKTTDAELLAFLPLIEREAGDDRNFVRRPSIGPCATSASATPRSTPRPSRRPNGSSPKTARAARWNGNDARRELTSPAIRQGLGLST